MVLKHFHIIGTCMLAHVTIVLLQTYLYLEFLRFTFAINPYHFPWYCNWYPYIIYSIKVDNIGRYHIGNILCIGYLKTQ